MDKNKAVEFVKTFGAGWDHFLSCIDFSHTSLDSQALAWMNEIGMASNQLNQEESNGN